MNSSAFPWSFRLGRLRGGGAVILFTGAAHEAEIAEVQDHTSAVSVRDVIVRDFRSLPIAAA